jgi:hypothetical protein
MPSTNIKHTRSSRTRVKRIITIGAIPALIAAAGGAYLLRSFQAHRRPRPVERELLWGDHKVQLPSDGVGKLFYRRYSVTIDQPQINEAALLKQIELNFPDFSPKVLADFTKTRGDRHTLRVGDEFNIGILGPWDGKVRVSEVKRNSFTFVTLEGHPEAGQITFAVVPDPGRPGALRFEINSWARSRDALVNLSYEQMKIGKEVQKNVWTIFCENVVAASGGKQAGEVEVITEQRDEEGEVIPVV